MLLDFGAARQALSNKSKSLTSLISPGYSPIEQYYKERDEQGPWTDIYGVGATLYRCITGNAPIDAIDRSTSGNAEHAHVLGRVSDSHADKYSDRFLKAIDSALAFAPEDRPQSIKEWRSAFAVPDEKTTQPRVSTSNALAEGQPDTPDESITHERKRSWFQRMGLFGGGIVVLLLAIGVYLSLHGNSQWIFVDPSTITTNLDRNSPLGLATNKSVWVTKFGELTLVEHANGKITGNYNDWEGKITGTLYGLKLHGYWIEDKPDVPCATERDGSKYWGRLIFRFDEDVTNFTGRWGYCETAIESEWSGKRIG